MAARTVKKPTLETVAQRAKVSMATVSQVMRGTGRISEQTRQNVLRAAKELHYVPDNRAASMRSKQNREIGFAIHQIANPFNAEVISGVSDLLETEGYLVSVLDSRDDADRQAQQLETFIRNGRGGLLWVPALASAASDTLDMLRVQGIPTVTFLRRPGGDGFDHLGLRNTKAMATATTHLADLGHRNIVYFGGTVMTDVRQDRINGYTQVMAERGLAAPVIWESLDNKLAGRDAMRDLLAQHPDVTAIVCNGDMVALGACLALSQRGMTPGRDFSIVGFDDIADAKVATPALTTMGVSPYNLGRRLARMMLDRLQDPDMPVVTCEIDVDLVVRDTTAPPPAESE